jgi:hypothetical protein
MIEPERVGPQPRGDIGNVTIVKIGSQEKASRRPEIPGADQKPILPDTDCMSLAADQTATGGSKTRPRSALDNCGGRSNSIRSALLRIFMRGMGVWFLEGVEAFWSPECS